MTRLQRVLVISVSDQTAVVVLDVRTQFVLKILFCVSHVLEMDAAENHYPEGARASTKALLTTTACTGEVEICSTLFIESGSVYVHALLTSTY